MAKHLVDTDVYIDLIQSGSTLPILRQLYEKEAPGIFFSSVVAEELLAGARSLFHPFEKAGRVVTPNHNVWKESGMVLAKILTRRPDLRIKLPALVNDCLIALSARFIGATVYTKNRDDFLLIQTIEQFQLVVIH